MDDKNLKQLLCEYYNNNPFNKKKMKKTRAEKFREMFSSEEQTAIINALYRRNYSQISENKIDNREMQLICMCQELAKELMS